ncbi:hypothetical protein LCGC14_1935090 [marine sediment metagenome]|uniref:Uncharacterized protein n=1 Tax=marine sediment metagenome TaxID=412755 RepID=A0A0F9GAB6_9ZZZZ
MQTIIRLVVAMAVLFAVRLPQSLNRAMRRELRLPSAVMLRGIPHWRYRSGLVLPMMGGGAVNSLELLKCAPSLDPVADAFAGTVNSDVHNMAQFDEAMFIIYWGVGATGTTVITVEACDDVTPTNQTAIVFWYREIQTGDTDGAWTKAAVAGFTTTAGSQSIIQIMVKAADVAAASVNSTVGNPYVRLNCVEGVNSPILGGIMFLGIAGRYQEDINATTIV